MPCLCGNKVDRHETHKVQCQVCLQFVHGKCYKIENAEIVFLKNFKCNDCLSYRRRSLSASTFFVGSDNVAELEGVSENPVTLMTSIADKNISHNSANLTDVSISNHGSACSIPATDAVSISLVDIYNELILLKTSNENLTYIVSALRSDNAKLLGKVDELERVVVNLQSYMPNVISNAVVEMPNMLSQKIKNKDKQLNLSWAEVVVADGNKNNKSLVDLTVGKSISSSSTNNNVNGKIIISPNIMKVPAINYRHNSNEIASEVVAKNLPRQINNNVVVNEKGFEPVVNRKARKNNNIVVGSCVTTELDVVVPKKWLHLSSFKSSVTADNIIYYVSKHTGVDVKFLACNSLIKKDVQIDLLKKVNFKIGVAAEFYDKLLCPNLWPVEVKVRPFRFRQNTNNNV